MKTVKITEFYTFKLDGNEFVIELINCIDDDYVFVDQSFHSVQFDSASKFVDKIHNLQFDSASKFFDKIHNLQEALYAVGYTSFQVYNRLKEAIVLNGGELDMVKTIEVKDL